MSKFYILRSFSYLGPRGEVQLVGPFDSRAVASMYKTRTDKGARPRTMHDFCYSSRVVAESKAPTNPDFRPGPCEEVVMECEEAVRIKELKAALKDCSYTRTTPKKDREYVIEQCRFHGLHVNTNDGCLFLSLNKNTYDEYKMVHGVAREAKVHFIITSEGLMYTLHERKCSCYFDAIEAHNMDTYAKLDTHIETLLGL